MRDWKTTVSGVLSAIGMVLPMTFGVPPEVGNSITTLGLFLVGLFAKDK